MISKILREKEKDTFCKELEIDNSILEILLKMDNNKAKYFDGKNYYDLDIKIARKYV